MGDGSREFLEIGTGVVAILGAQDQMVRSCHERRKENTRVEMEEDERKRQRAQDSP